MDPKPASPSSSPNSSSSTSSNNKDSPPPQPPTPNSTYPTTFIQANTQSFKQVVQMLTGAPESAAAKKHTVIPPVSKPTKNNKLYERRNSMKNLKMISPLIPSLISGRHSGQEVLSPSVLDFPSLVLSPVTPLRDRFERGGQIPKLLPLFPLTSPRMESSGENSV